MFTRAELCDRPVYTYVTEQEGVNECAREIRRSKYIAIDTETTGLRPYHGDRVRLLSVSCDTGRTWVLDCFSVDPRKCIRSLAGKKVVAHNWAFDANFLSQYGWKFERTKLRDTHILGFLLHCGSGRKSNLGYLLQRYLGLNVDKSFQKSDWSGTLSAEQLDYAARDTKHLLDLYFILLKKCAQARLKKIVALEHHVLRSVLWMMRTGVQVDTKLWIELYEQARVKRKDTDHAMRALVSTRRYGAAWNWRKATDIKSALFRLGVSVQSTSKKKMALALDGVSGPAEEFIRLLLAWRRADQVVKSFGPKWLTSIDQHSKVHAQPQQCLPETGRFSYSSPNLQQIVKGAHRYCFHDGYGRTIVKADYSTLELRMIAHIANDENMIEAFVNNEDLHIKTAQRVLGVAEPSKNDRTLAKALNFGMVYGAGPETIREQLAANWGIVLTLDQCADYRKQFFATYRGVAAYLERAKKNSDYSWRSPWGRRRLGMGQVYNEKTRRVQNQFNRWANTPVQGTSADGAKKALADVYKYRKQIPGLKCLMFIHDELVVSVPTVWAPIAGPWLKAIMENAMQPLLGKVPCLVEYKFARTWGG